jgi:outer membrane protein assembly factor BamD (BamD/ComL family)
LFVLILSRSALSLEKPFRNLSMKKYLVILFSVFVVTASFSQSKKVFQQNYLKAKTLFDNGDYVQAMHVFKGLAVEHPNNQFEEYGYYYCGLSAYRADKYQDARFILLQLVQKYPTWKQKDEVNYLLANVLLIEKDTTRALFYIEEIQNKELVKEAKVMLEYYDITVIDSSAIDHSIDTLKIHLVRDPENTKLAKKIAKKLNKKGNTIEEKIYLEYLIQDYKLDEKKYVKGLFKKTEKKEVYQIAVILPFNYDNKKMLSRRLRYYEMLTGIELAVDSLKQQGVSVELTVFDSKNDSATVANIFLDKQVKNADLLFGPVYEKNAKMAAHFALENEIFYVNPLYGNADITFGNRFVYLQSPSFSMEATKAAQFGATFPNPDVVILYGEKTKDSIKAYAYKREIENLGKKVRVVKQFSQDNMNRLGDFMERNNNDSLSHIYVATDNDYAGASIMSSLEEYDFQCPVIAPKKWLNIQLLGNDFSPYRRRQVHFIGVNYLDMDSCEQVCDFRKDVQKVWNTKPTNLAYYSAIGFESMFYFGTALHSYGTVISVGLKEQGYTKGILFQGYEYSQYSNGVVPIYVLDESYGLKMVNQQ